MGRVLAFEAFDALVDRAPLQRDAVALHPSRLAIEVGLVKHRWRVPKLTRCQRSISVLLAAQVAEEGEQVLRVVLVHGRVGRRANHDGRKGAVAKEHHGHAKRQRVQGPPALLVTVNQDGCDATDEECEVHQRT